MSRELDALRTQLGELEGHRDGTADLAGYRRPGGAARFCRDVLRDPAHLAWQLEAWDALETHDLLAVRSCNAAGKTAWDARTAAFECYVNESLVLYGSASWAQNRQQGAKELRKLLDRADGLGGDVFQYGLVPGRGTGMIYFLGGDDVSALQGHHDRRVVVILDEFQGSGDELLEAAFANISGGESKLIVTGNPLQFGTAFHSIFRKSAPGWWKRKVAADEIIADPAYDLIPGLVTKRWCDQMVWQYGHDHPVYGSRVLAEFPSTAEAAMFPAEHVVAAFERHRTGELLRKVGRRSRVIGLDCAASAEGDLNAAAVARGGHVEFIETWNEPDSMRTVGRVIELLRRLQVPREGNVAMANRLREAGLVGYALLDARGAMGDPLEVSGPPARIVADANSVGKGIADRLAEQGYAVDHFNGARRPEDEADAERYQNRRAEVFDRFRTMLVRGEVALPYSPELEAELLTCSSFTNSRGLLQVVDKEAWKRLLGGRSPDRLDAAVMAVAADGSVSFDIDPALESAVSL